LGVFLRPSSDQNCTGYENVFRNYSGHLYAGVGDRVFPGSSAYPEYESGSNQQITEDNRVENGLSFRVFE
jgi:hypothetical protein